MDNSHSDFDDKIKALQDNYRLGLPEKLTSIKTLHQSFSHSKNNYTAIEPLEKALHKLAGSAGTYGFNKLSALAKHAKKYCNDLQDGKSNSQLLNQLNELIIEITSINFYANPSSIIYTKFENRLKNEIDIYTKNSDFGDELKNHFEQFNYEHNHFKSLDAIIEKTNKTPANIVIIDSDNINTLKILAEKIDLKNKNFTIIILHSSDSFSARLFAVRAGCDVFIAKPVDINLLDSKIFENIKSEDFSLYRVLIINDQQEQIDYYQLILEQAKFDVSSIKNPGAILRTLCQINPDAILLDINMPICNGIELAKIIRQYHTHFNIPIIFLSANEIKENISQVRTSGGDDYLVKPIKPKSLIETLQTRSKRYRAMKKIMNSDSLTGLLNHSNCKFKLENEILRAKRYKRPLTIALIDIDHFKKVNDTYGHQAGDTVIKNISTLLKIQLRRTDIIGRYGGEEFMVIMPETNMINGQTAIEKIRIQFSKQLTQFDSKEIQCTFSAGVASLEHAFEVSTLIECADKALYKAKDKGRNCVVLYTSRQ
jgi:diguanylate cyclase (GGDEF)-like protein